MGIEINDHRRFWDEEQQKAKEIYVRKQLQMGLYNIQKDTHIGITWEPGEEDVNFIVYVLEGEMKFRSHETEFTLYKDSSALFTYEPYNIHGSSLTPVRMIMFSTNPAFQKVEESNACFDKLKEVELRDIYTIGHSQRVSTYAMSIALAIDPTYDITTLGSAATFHDLGKYYTLIEILQKPGKLSEEEYAIIRRHPLDGYNLLIDSHGKRVADCILQHHERMDGSGYPKGLTGEDICMDARIIAVADVFDAITCKRVYNEPVSFLEALAMMEQEAHLYDPLVLSALRDLIISGKLRPSYVNQCK